MGIDEKFDMERSYTFTGEQLIRFTAEIMAVANARATQTPEKEIGLWYMRLKTLRGAEIVIGAALQHAGMGTEEEWAGWDILQKHAATAGCD